MEWKTVIQMIIFSVKMIMRYGPSLWKIGKNIYDDVEGMSKEAPEPLSSTSKAQQWNNKALVYHIENKGIVPPRLKLNELRENVWTAKNQLAEDRKPISDPKLMVA
jgi:hypothetical protein